MDTDTAWDALATRRRTFADLLDSLTPQQWDTASLCDAWSVREVATHMMVGQTGSFGGFLTAMVKARGRFAVANQVLVDRRSSRPTHEIADDFRTHAGNRFAPPTLDWHAPLSDFLVHRLDITVPLGMTVPVPSEEPDQVWPEALGFLVSRKAQMGFTGAGMPSLAYRASDVDWVHGAGEDVSGPAAVLALALTRRDARLDELEGPGAVVLRDWARR